MRSRLRLLWYDRHYAWAFIASICRSTRQVPLLLTPSSVPKAWQNSLADRHLNNALHADWATFYQEFIVRNPEIHGDASTLQRCAYGLSAGKLGKCSCCPAYLDKSTRQAVRVPSKSPNGHGNSLSSLWRSVCRLLEEDISWWQQYCSGSSSVQSHGKDRRNQLRRRKRRQYACWTSWDASSVPVTSLVIATSAITANASLKNPRMKFSWSLSK